MHSYRQDLRDQLTADANGPATVPKENAGALASLAVTGTAVVLGATTLAGTEVAGILNISSGLVTSASWPTADPHNAGQLWSNAGALTVSAG